MIISCHELFDGIIICLLINWFIRTYFFNITLHISSKFRIIKFTVYVIIWLNQCETKFCWFELIGDFLSKSFQLKITYMLGDCSISSYFIILHKLDKIGFIKCWRRLRLLLNNFSFGYFYILTLNKVWHVLLFDCNF
jgi:hypothetical protein